MYDASQFGQLNRLTGDFGMWTPMWLAECDLKPTPKLKVVRQLIRTHKSAPSIFKALVNSL